jgi:hypothetical protein
LRAEQDGWRIWEVASKERAACVAVKPAEGTAWPDLSVVKGSITGSGGFYMFLADKSSLPYFGFYGRYRYPGKTVVRTGDSTVSDVNNRDTVLSWEGLRVSFQVTTQAGVGGVYRPSGSNWGTFELLGAFRDDQPRPAAPADIDARATGTVDFTGVDGAYRTMLRCHSYIAGT